MARAKGKMELIVDSGVVRDDVFVIEMRVPADEPDWDDVKVVIEFDQGAPHEQSARSALRETPQAGRAALVVTRPTQQIISSVRVMARDGGGVSVRTGSAYGLDALFPISEGDEMPKSLARDATLRDAETLSFLVHQMLSQDRHSIYVKTEAVKKLSYMSMQTGELHHVARAIELIDHYITYEEHFKGLRTKLHPIHFRVSMLFIRVLCNIVIGDFERANRDFETLFETRRHVAAIPLMASNLSRAVLIYGWLLLAAGLRDAGDKVLEAVIDMFREAAAHMPARRQRAFLELGTSLRSAGEAVVCRAAARKDDAFWRAQAPASRIASYSRLEPGAGQARLAEQLGKCADHFRTTLKA